MPRPFFHIYLSLNYIERLINMTTGEIETSFQHEFPEFAIEASRLQTFEDWPRMMKQRPEQMADAGFFYTQISDRVICFSCGGGSGQWHEDDDPWEQHAIWYKKCHYFDLIKGPEFIAEVERKFDRMKKAESTDDKPTPTSSPKQSDEHTNDSDDAKPSFNANSNDARLCKICFVNEYSTIFLPCGHIMACGKCAAAQTKCPICRKPFENINRIFLP